MQINVTDEFVERMKKYLREEGRYLMPLEGFIEECVDLLIESNPFGIGDICAHCDECMHHKSVEDWKKEQGGEL
jgi:hypothetical protein